MRDSLSQNAIPFASIYFRNQHYLTSVQGELQLNAKPGIELIEVKSPQYHPQSIRLDTSIKSYVVYMEKKYPFMSHPQTDEDTRKIIHSLIQHHKNSTHRPYAPFAYHSYSKLNLSSTISSTKNEKKGGFLKKILSKYPNDNLLIMEMLSEKRYANQIAQTEELKAVKSSDISIPMLVIEQVQLNNISIFNNVIPLIGKDYESPLSEKAENRYVFYIEDSVKIGGTPFCCIKFNRSPNCFFRALSGYMWVDLNQKLVHAFIASPEHEQAEVPFFIQQSYVKIGTHIFPYQKEVFIEKINRSKNLKIRAKIFSQNLGFDTTVRFTSSNFDETFINYPAVADQEHSQLWNQYRALPLSASDSATYDFYKKVDKSKFLQRALRLGENIYFGFFPWGNINFLTERFLNFNDVEKVRLGLGVETNSKFSNIHQLNAFIGYGFGDARLKYGFGHQLLVYQPLKVFWSNNFKNDLQEAGLPIFPFDRPQYSSENLRNFTLQIMDFNREWQSQLKAHPFRFLDIMIGTQFSRISNLYNYSFKGKKIENMKFFEVNATLRWAYGERNIKYFEYQKLISSNYPVVYMSFAKGLAWFGAEYSYSKFDFKIEENIKIFRLGLLGVQLLYSSTLGEVPYTKLFNGKGSLQNGSVLIHNSFETMRYNEFLSNQFLGIFGTHDLGKFFTPLRMVQPNIILVHNMGWGSITNAAFHQNLPFKFGSMNRGFFESGVFLSNLITLRLNSFKVGLGLGLIRRYGAYSSSKTSENLVFKFSLNFKA